MERDEKKIEDFINKLMSNETLEQPSTDFTDNVMSRIEAISSSTVYKPLIPKYVWWFIIAGFIGLVVYLINKQPSGKSSFLDRYNLPEISLNPLEGFSYDFSNVLMYAMILLAIMVSIQIPLLKQYFNKSMAY